MLRFCVNKVLLATKLAYFFFFFSYSSVTPYIAVFMSSNGLNAEQAGYILGARLFAQFLSGPVWGAIADKTRKYKLMLLLQIIVSTMLLFSAPWVPFMLPKDAMMSNLGGSSPTLDKNVTESTFTTLPSPKVYFRASHSTSKPLPFSGFTAFVNRKVATSITKNVSQELDATFTTPSNLSTTRSNKNPSSNNKTIKYNTETLFYVMVSVFTLVGIFDGGILLLIDNSVINSLKEAPGSNFGKQRLWGAVGFGLASLASGVGIELSGNVGPNYFTMFYIFTGSNICLMVACSFLKMPIQPTIKEGNGASLDQQQNVTVLNGLVRALRKPSVLFFFTTVLMMGMADNLLYSFMFLYIQDLNGSKIVMGLSVLVSCCAEALIFPFTNSIIKRLRGNLPAIALSFGVYSLRYFGFSLVQDAWYILLLQLLHSVCFALFWAAAVFHTTTIAPKGMEATFLGIQNGIFFGIAGGTASIIGGIVYKNFGGRNLFRGYAGICATWTLLLLLHIFERKKNGKLHCAEDEEANENVKDKQGTEDEMEELSPSKRLFSHADE
ncbi:major facilitator superfamily domain-containing protein 6-like [Rhopilema esculentum]|uniref:major facilitator superfamily domain-containing protein 6-like n=1 Tax=Rhopilema esculentum TaxID=499914 RepID=UPI0031D5F636|eukprot:gene15267-6476_t